MVPLEKLLRKTDNTKLISQYYSALMADSKLRFVNAQARWATLYIQLTDDDWTEFVDT